MEYRYSVEEFDLITDEHIRSLNAYCKQKQAENTCDQLNAEARVFHTGKRYEVYER